MPDRHKPDDKPKAVRMPGGLLARVKTAAETEGASVNGFIVAAIEEKLQRRGSTTPARPRRQGATTSKPSADTTPPATFRPPRCTHQGTRVIGGYCKTCDHMIEPGGLWREG